MPELQKASAFNLIADNIIFDVDKIKLLLTKSPNKYSAGPDWNTNYFIKRTFEFIAFTTFLNISKIFYKFKPIWPQYLKAKVLNKIW